MATLNIDTEQGQPEFNEAEQEALAVGEELQQQEQAMLAGKFKDAEELEKAYIELQQKLGQGKDEEQPEGVRNEESETEEVDEEDVGDDFESLYKGEISKSGTPILPSKRQRKVPEKIQVSKDDLAELTNTPEVQTEESQNEDVSLDQITEEENNEDLAEDSETSNS